MKTIELIKEKIELPEQYSVPAETKAAAANLVKLAATITAVSTPKDNESAGLIVRDIRAAVKDVEVVRQTLTKPLLAAQRDLKALADDYCKPLISEQKRLERMATAYLEVEQAKIAAEEAERRKAFEEAQKRALEASAKARESESILDKMNAARANQSVQTIIAAPMPELEKARGQQMRQVLKYEVLDIRAVYAARPELCKLEISPAAVKASLHPDHPCPGIKCWFENEAIFTTR